MKIQEQGVFIGTAGWSVPGFLKAGFPPDGSHLERYSQVFNAVEINSSFYRDHLPETYLKWAETVPVDFRFAVKLSRYFTQQTRLTESGPRLREVILGISNLGRKLGPVLIQLPPSLDFQQKVAVRFFGDLRALHEGALCLEPRHPSWSSPAALSLLKKFEIGKVIADPERCPLPDPQRAGVESLLYCRLHGSPEIYKSSYSEELLQEGSSLLQAAADEGKPAWCIFDNTTFGHATSNALRMREIWRRGPGRIPGQNLNDSADLPAA